MKRKRQKPIFPKIVLLFVLLVLLYCSIVINVMIDTSQEIVCIGKEFTPHVTATLIGFDVSKYIEQEGFVNTEVEGKYVVAFRPSFSFIKYRKTYIVCDAEKPVIELSGEKNMTVLKDISNFVEPGFTATDNCDGDITSRVGVTIKKKEDANNLYSVTYCVTDCAGNTGVAERTVEVITGYVYLTFDDGPSLDTTPQILDILEKKNVKATFFLIGFSGDEKNRLVKKEYSSGHTLGLHGYSHKYSEIYTSLDVLKENFTKLESMIKELTDGYTSKVIRFPGGSSNTVSKKYSKGIMTEAVKYYAYTDYIYFDWNVDSCDAGGAETSEEVYNNVISGIREGRSNVVLMHDFAGNQKTVDALEDVIDYCIDKGYKIEPLTSETIPVHHSISN